MPHSWVVGLKEDVVAFPHPDQQGIYANRLYRQPISVSDGKFVAGHGEAEDGFCGGVHEAQANCLSLAHLQGLGVISYSTIYEVVGIGYCATSNHPALHHRAHAAHSAAALQPFESLIRCT